MQAENQFDSWMCGHGKSNWDTLFKETRLSFQAGFFVLID